MIAIIFGTVAVCIILLLLTIITQMNNELLKVGSKNLDRTAAQLQEIIELVDNIYFRLKNRLDKDD